MSIRIINTAQAVEILKNHRSSGAGRVFGVSFIKRTDNTEKTLNARFGVTSALKGGKLGYKAADKGLMTVYDINAQSYKCINLSALRSLTVDGAAYQIA
jgi:hypothetical protein